MRKLGCVTICLAILIGPAVDRADAGLLSLGGYSGWCNGEWPDGNWGDGEGPLKGWHHRSQDRDWEGELADWRSQWEEKWQEKREEVCDRIAERHEHFKETWDERHQQRNERHEERISKFKEKIAELSEGRSERLQQWLDTAQEKWTEKREALVERREERVDQYEQRIEECKEWIESGGESGDSPLLPFVFRHGLHDVTGGDYSGHDHPSYLMTGGKLMGSGLVRGSFHLQDGVFAPGHSPGMVEFSDGFSLEGGALEIEIQGDGGAPGVDFDFLDITGTAFLDSTLQLLLLDGFEPEDEFAFDVLTATDVVFGEDFIFDQTGLSPWDGSFDLSIVAGGNGEILRLTALGGSLLIPEQLSGSAETISSVPEPPTIVTMLVGGVYLLAFAWRRRRQTGAGL